MGWSHAGNTRQKYQHYYNDDSFDAVLTMVDGITPANISQASKKTKDLLKPRLCPNCSESNKPDSKFCVKYKFVLSYDVFNERMEEAEKTKKTLTSLEEKTASLQATIDKMHKQIEKMIEARKTKAILREFEVRGLKGEPVQGPLTDYDIEQIMLWDSYEDDCYNEYWDNWQKDQQRMYKEYLRQEGEEEKQLQQQKRNSSTQKRY